MSAGDQTMRVVAVSHKADMVRVKTTHYTAICPATDREVEVDEVFGFTHCGRTIYRFYGYDNVARHAVQWDVTDASLVPDEIRWAVAS